MVYLVSHINNKLYNNKIMTNKEVHDKLKDLDSKIERVLSILESDPSIGRKGLHEQVTENQQAIKQNTDFNNEIKVKVTTIGGIVAFISVGLWELAKFFIFKK